MNHFNVPLRIVLYRENGQWVAHCLELDVCGSGSTRPEALESLRESVFMQLKFSIEHDTPENFFRPAPSDIQQLFFKGRDANRHAVNLSFELSEHVVVDSIETREYEEDSKACDNDAVMA